MKNKNEIFEIKQYVKLAHGDSEWIKLRTCMFKKSAQTVAKEFVQKGIAKKDIAIRKITYEEVEF
jgi:hypothetical protein